MSETCLAVVLSDIHLGEEDSIWMKFEQDGLAFDDQVASRIKNLIQSGTGQDRIEYLILAGDVLDLSLSSRVEAFKSFRHFLKEFVDLFTTLVYVPGNHDHHVWFALQEEARIFSQIRDGEDVQPYYHAFIPTISREGLELPGVEKISKPYGAKTFLYYLLPERSAEEGKNFLVTYPNIYLDLGSEARILITHGHFFEEAWRIFTDAFPKSLELSHLSYGLLEQLNSPFTEFGWYHLGQAGKLSDLLEKIWEELHSGQDRTLDGVVDDLGYYLDERLDYRPKNKKGFVAWMEQVVGNMKEFSSDRLIDLAMMVLKRLVAAQISPEDPRTSGAPLRNVPDIFKDPRRKNKITEYLAIAYDDDDFPFDTFIFGHTHVPIIRNPENCDISVHGKKLKAYNTGGWVADSLEPGALRKSRPAIFGIEETGTILPIEVPWPAKSDFEKVIREAKDSVDRKKRLKQAVKKNLKR